MEIVRKKVCMDDYISHLPGKIPCIEYNGNLSDITAFPDANGGNMGHIVCDLLLTKNGRSKVIRYLEVLEKYRYVNNIIENNLLLKPSTGNNPYLANEIYLTECENIDPYSCEVLLTSDVHKVYQNYYKCDKTLDENKTYIVVNEEEYNKLFSISIWWETYLDFAGGHNAFVRYFTGGDSYWGCDASEVTDNYAYNSYDGIYEIREDASDALKGTYDNYPEAKNDLDDDYSAGHHIVMIRPYFKFCLDFEKLFLGYYKTPRYLYEGCNGDVPTEVYTILASQYKEKYDKVSCEVESGYENFVAFIDGIKNKVQIPVNGNIDIINDYWDKDSTNPTNGAYFVAPYIEIPLCLESDFVDEGLYSLYENTNDFENINYENLGNISQGEELNDGEGIRVVSPMFDVLNIESGVIEHTTPYIFENENIQGLLRKNTENLVYSCSATTSHNPSGQYDVLISNGEENSIRWKCCSIPNFNGNIDKETLFLGDIPYRSDFSQTNRSHYYVKPAYLNGCRTEPTFKQDCENQGLGGLNEMQVILPVFCNLPRPSSSWRQITGDNTGGETEVKYKMFDNGQPIGELKENIKWHAEPIHTSVFGQETDLWVVKYEFETAKNEDGTENHIANLLTYKYKPAVPVGDDDVYFFDPALNGLTEEPKVDIDVSIDRGAGAAWERHFKLMECNTLEDLENYGNNYFNIRDL